MLKEYRLKQKSFCDFIINSKKNNSISHAYLIETNGVDYAFDLSLSLAKYFLCDKETDSDSCENCNRCYLIDNDNYPDIEIIDDVNVIKKEQMLDLQKKFVTKPLYGKYRIYIVKDAGLLNKSSANTILKFLEEPSDNITAILLTSNINSVLDTIVSRCKTFSLVGNKENQLAAIFKKYYDITDGFEDFVEKELKKIVDFYYEIEKTKTKKLLDSNLYMFKDNIDILLNVGLILYYDVLNIKLERTIECFENYKEMILNVAKNNEIDDIINKIDILNKFILNANFNVNKELFIDNFIISMGGII